MHVIKVKTGETLKELCRKKQKLLRNTHDELQQCAMHAVACGEYGPAIKTLKYLVELENESSWLSRLMKDEGLDD